MRPDPSYLAFDFGEREYSIRSNSLVARRLESGTRG